MHSLLFLLLSLASNNSSRPLITCESIPPARIEAAIHHRLGPVSKDQSSTHSTCSYSSADVSVTIAIHQLTGEFNLTAELENLRAAFPGSTLRELKGTSAPAVVLELPGAGTQLHLLPPGNEYILISVLGLSAGHDGLDAATEIAAALVGRGALPNISAK